MIPSKLKNIANSALGSSDFSETLKHSWTYFSGAAALKGLSIIGIPIMTRLLTPEEYGILNIFATYCTLGGIILTVNLHVGIGRYYFEKKQDFQEFLGTATLLPFVFLVGAMLFSIIYQETIAKWLDLPVITILFIVPIALEGLLKGLHLQVFRAMREPKKVRSLSVITGYIGFVLGIVLVYLHSKEGRYEGKLWSSLIMVFVSGGIVLSRIWPMIKIRVKWQHIKYMLNYSVPLLPSYISGLILAQFDRVMIGSYLGKGDAGQYSFAYNIAMLLAMVMNALYYSWSPKYYEYMNKKDYESHDRDTVKLLNLLSAITCALILFADWIGYILGSKSFHESLYLIPVIILGQYMMAVNPIYKRHISYAKKTIYTSISVVVAGALNVVLNAMFIPEYGAIAAAFTTLASYFLMFLIVFAVAKYIIRIHVTPLKFIADKVLIVSAVCAYYYVDLYALDLPAWAGVFSKFFMLLFCVAILFRNRLPKIA